MTMGFLPYLFMGLMTLLVLILSPSLSMAQVSAKGGPVMIGSDTYSMDQKSLTQTFVGRVQIQQADSRLQADQITITHLKSAGGNGMGEVSLIEARGNVYYVTPKRVFAVTWPSIPPQAILWSLRVRSY